jgi:ribonuclease BN (tRNA processing enzyme)
MARQAGVNTLVFTHLQPNTDAAWIRADAGIEFSGRIIVGEDLMEISAVKQLRVEV